METRAVFLLTLPGCCQLGLHSVFPRTEIQAGKAAKCLWSPRERERELWKSGNSNEVILPRSACSLSTHSSWAGPTQSQGAWKVPSSCAQRAGSWKCLETFWFPLMISISFLLFLFLSSQVDMLQSWPHWRKRLWLCVILDSWRKESDWLSLSQRPIAGPIHWGGIGCHTEKKKKKKKLREPSCGQRVGGESPRSYFKLGKLLQYLCASIMWQTTEVQLSWKAASGWKDSPTNKWNKGPVAWGHWGTSPGSVARPSVWPQKLLTPQFLYLWNIHLSKIQTKKNTVFFFFFETNEAC